MMRMKLVLSLVSGVVLGLCGGVAWAGEDVVSRCSQAFSEPTQRLACIQALSGQQQQTRALSAWQEELARNEDARNEAARRQALGLALFGSGPAMINGMNQGFQNMQVHPYVLPMPQAPQR